MHLRSLRCPRKTRTPARYESSSFSTTIVMVFTPALRGSCTSNGR